MGYRDGDIPETDDELYRSIDRPRCHGCVFPGGRHGGPGCTFEREPVFEPDQPIRIKNELSQFDGRPGIVVRQSPESGTVVVKLHRDLDRFDPLLLSFGPNEVREEDGGE